MFENTGVANLIKIYQEFLLAKPDTELEASSLVTSETGGFGALERRLDLELQVHQGEEALKPDFKQEALSFVNSVFEPGGFGASERPQLAADSVANSYIRVSLKFSDSVWMSIRDHRFKTIFSALSVSGNTENFRIHASSLPINFKIGNADGVSVYVEGNLVDQEPYKLGSISKFALNL